MSVHEIYQPTPGVPDFHIPDRMKYRPDKGAQDLYEALARFRKGTDSQLDRDILRSNGITGATSNGVFRALK